MLIVILVISYQGSLRAQFWVHCCSYFSLMNCQIELLQILDYNYADDITIYKTIHSNEDILQLQKDLDNLSKWASAWLMTFNVNKCEHLVITKMHSPISSEYKISGCNINKVTSAKYLKVTINHDPSWANHIGIISREGSAVLRFLQRNLRQCSLPIKSLAYLTYVRSILEHASMVWALMSVPISWL